MQLLKKMQLLKRNAAAKKSAAAAPQSESLHVSYFTVRGTSTMAHATTLHALDRRSQREIRGDFIELCKACGTRTNVPNGSPDKPSNSWRYKYMYHGLQVIAEPASRQVRERGGDISFCGAADVNETQCEQATTSKEKHERERREGHARWERERERGGGEARRGGERR